MPFANEHAARQTDPGRYKRFRRVHPDGFPAGVDVIMGVRDGPDGEVTEIQSLRFDAGKWSPAKAKAWLKEHDFSTGNFEEAMGEREDAATRARPTVEYLEAVLEQARALLSPHEWQKIHRLALPSSGGKARRRRGSTSMRAAVPGHSVPEAEGAWDVDAALGRLRAWAGVDREDATAEAWARYADGFALIDAKARETLGAYKLPHHDVRDGRLVLARQGLFAAAAAVQGGRGGASIPEADLAGVRRHLARHYRDLDLTAPWEREAAVRAVPVFHVEPLEKVIYVAVMVPGEKDSFGTVLTAEVIREAAHGFAEVREIVVDHRVHPDDWPDGVDAKVASTVEGGSVVEQAYFDGRLWDQARAQAFLDEHRIEKGVVEPEPPLRPVLVESAIAPVDLSEMHGTKLKEPLRAGSWYIGAHHPAWTREDLEGFTGASVGAYFEP